MPLLSVLSIGLRPVIIFNVFYFIKNIYISPSVHPSSVSPFYQSKNHPVFQCHLPLLPPPTNNTVATAKSFSRCVQWCLPRVITPLGFHPHILSRPLVPSGLLLAKSNPVVQPYPFGMVLYHRSSTRIKLSIGSHPTVWPQ